MSDVFYREFLVPRSDAQVTHSPERPRADALHTPSVEPTGPDENSEPGSRFSSLCLLFRCACSEVHNNCQENLT